MEQRWDGDAESILEMRLWGSGLEQHWCADTKSTPKM